MFPVIARSALGRKNRNKLISGARQKFTSSWRTNSYGRATTQKDQRYKFVQISSNPKCLSNPTPKILVMSFCTILAQLTHQSFLLVLWGVSHHFARIVRTVSHLSLRGWTCLVIFFDNGLDDNIRLSANLKNVGGEMEEERDHCLFNSQKEPVVKNREISWFWVFLWDFVIFLKD